MTHELNLYIFGSFGWKTWTTKTNHWGGSSILVRAPACHAGGCEFKPRLSREKRFSSGSVFLFSCEFYFRWLTRFGWFYSFLIALGQSHPSMHRRNNLYEKHRSQRSVNRGCNNITGINHETKEKSVFSTSDKGGQTQAKWRVAARKRSAYDLWTLMLWKFLFFFAKKRNFAWQQDEYLYIWLVILRL